MTPPVGTDTKTSRGHARQPPAPTSPAGAECAKPSPSDPAWPLRHKPSVAGRLEGGGGGVTAKRDPPAAHRRTRPPPPRRRNAAHHMAHPTPDRLHGARRAGEAGMAGYRRTRRPQMTTTPLGRPITPPTRPMPTTSTRGQGVHDNGPSQGQHPSAPRKVKGGTAEQPRRPLPSRHHRSRITCNDTHTP